MSTYLHFFISLTTSICLFSLFSLLQYPIQTIYGQDINISLGSKNESLSNDIIEEYSKVTIGMVQNGTFILAETKEPKNLTSTAPQEAVDVVLMNLTQYEGKAILVSYDLLQEDLLYGVVVIDIGSPIVNKLVTKIYGFQ